MPTRPPVTYFMMVMALVLLVPAALAEGGWKAGLMAALGVLLGMAGFAALGWPGVLLALLAVVLMALLI